MGGASQVNHRGPTRSIGFLHGVQGLLGIALVAVGLLLLMGVGAYYAYPAIARGKLDELNYSIETTAPLPSEALRDGFAPPDVAPLLPRLETASQVSSRPPVELVSERVPLARVATLDTPADEKPPPSLPASSYESIYPGFRIHPKYWDQPLWAGTDSYSYLDTSLPDGYQTVLGQVISPPAGVAAVASRIHIPLLRVDSAVSDLHILDLGDSRSYETPNNVVGHIPGTANPSDTGNGWYFGHLESPIRGEGNVFSRLPEIPELMKDGDPVYVTVESADGEFLYQVTDTRIVRPDDLRLYDADRAEITLVTCVPRLVYDHRLVVTAKLVGVKE